MRIRSSRVSPFIAYALLAVACSARPVPPVLHHDASSTVEDGGSTADGSGDATNGGDKTNAGSTANTQANGGASTGGSNSNAGAHTNAGGTTADDGTAASKKALLVIGGGSGKIDIYNFDRETGAATLLKSNTQVGGAPTFLAFDPKRTHVFAVNETDSGGVKSFILNSKTGELQLVNERSADGAGPTHLSLDNTGHWLLTANYSTGHVLSYPLTDDGQIGSQALDLAAGMNAHEILTSPTNNAAYVPCLGSGYIAQFTFTSSSGALSPLSPATLAATDRGPRHMAIHPKHPWLYVIHEQGSSIQAHTIGANGALTNLGSAVSTLKTPNPANTGAEVQVAPAGDFVYASNRGDDTIAVLSVGATGELTLQNTVKTGGTGPRHFSLDSTGRWLVVANQGSDSVTTFAVNPDTGALTAKGKTIAFESAQFAQVIDIPD